MARKDGRAETQHHTPKMLLKNFACRPSGRAVYVYDKHSGKALRKPTSIDNVGGQRRYYDAEVQGGIVSIESALSGLESATDPVIQKIIQGRSLGTLTDADRVTLALFCAVQFFRAPRMRETQVQIVSSIVDKSKAIAPNASNIEEIENSLENNSIKLTHIRHIAEGAINLVPILLSHDWFLMEPSGDRKFWVSDCPVALHNDRTFGPYGNLGFALPGIQIYLPISPTVALVLWERSLIRRCCIKRTHMLYTWQRRILEVLPWLPFFPTRAFTMRKLPTGT